MKKGLLTASASTVLALTALAQDTEASQKVYTVQRGDSLWKISREHQVTVEQLMTWNNLSSSLIYPGQKIHLAPPVKSVSGTQKGTSSSAGKNASQGTATYKVKAGDTLWHIARRYNTSVDQLKAVNNLKSDLIRVGQILTLPSGVKGENSSSKTASSTKSKVKTESNTTLTTYTVKAGDTLWAIARKFNMTVNSLKVINDLNSDLIRVGQVLRVAGPAGSSDQAKKADQTKKGVDQAKNKNSGSTPSFQTSALIEEAKKYLGVPFRWGGTSPNSGFDCSGFIQFIFRAQGVELPRTVASIWEVGTPVSKPQPGDLVFFETYTSGPSHAGIYLGSNQFIHSGTSTGVTISNMTTSYWSQRYLGAKRYH